MKLKRITAPLKQKAKEVVKRIKEMPFESEPLLKKPGYIDLSGKLATQKAFAALGGVKGATNRAIRKVQRAGKDRLKHGLVSQGAIDRLTQRKVKEAVQKAEIPLSQDIKNSAKSISRSIKNTPETLKSTATKAKDISKYIYENTGDAVAKGAGWVRKNPEIAAGQAIGGVINGSIYAVNPQLGAAITAAPGGPATLLSGALLATKRPNKVVEYGGKKMTKNRERILQGKKVENSVREKIGGKSIKNSVERIKDSARSIMAPINSNSVPSYRLMRVTA